MKGSTVLLLAVVAGLFLMNQKTKAAAAAPAGPITPNIVPVADVMPPVIPPKPDDALLAPEMKWEWDGTAWLQKPIGELAWEPGPVMPIDLVRGGVMWPGGDAPGSGGPEDPLGPSDPNWKYRPYLMIEPDMGIPVYSAL